MKNLLDLDFNLNDFCSKCDDELAVIAKTVKPVAALLISRYSKLILVKSEIFANTNADSDDLNQEGLFGLLNAISSFDPDKGVKFSTYAEVCIVNRMRSFLVKTNKNASFVGNIDELSEDSFPSVYETPESIFISKEFVSELLSGIYDVLSPLERKIFDLCINGESYRSAAEKLGITEKSVDNAMQRARKKIRALIQP